MSAKLDEPGCSKDTFQSILEGQLAKDILMYFKPLDELLKCHICFDYFNTCMITKCCHTFCSLCIRRYMTYKTQCPECFQEATEPELRINRQIDDIISIYCKIKNLLQSYAGNAVRSTNVSYNDQLSSPEDSQVPCTNNDVSNFDIDEHKIDEVCSNEVSVAEKQDKVSSVPNKKVSCPVCSLMVLPEKINIHLDRCLIEKEKDASSKRKPLAKVVYHLMSDKEIKKRLKENGLSPAGSRQSLVKRHKNFLLLYNSECDKVNPRPVSEILKQVEEEEAEIQKMEPSKLFQSGKNSSPVVIQEENERYVKQQKFQFNALLNDIHQRQTQRSSKAIQSDKACKDDRNIFAVTETDHVSPVKDFHRTLSPDLFDSSPLEEHSEESGSIESVLEPLAVNEESEAFGGFSSNSVEDFVVAKSGSRTQRRLKRKITGRGGSSTGDPT